MTHHLLAAVVLLALALPSQAATCPPAGARYVADNFVQRSEVVSLGSAHNATLGCKWRRDDGQEIWLNLGPTVTPLAETQARDAAVRADKDKARSPTVHMGVYECNGPGGVQTGPTFGLIDARRYRDFDGGTGTYRYDGGSSLLEMSSGPLKGMRYRRTGDILFRPLGDKGQIGPIACPINRGKSITGKW